MDIYYELGTVLSILYMLTHFIHTNAPWRKCYYSYFIKTDKEIK